MANDLAIVIKSVYDKTGIKLATEDLQKLHAEGKLPAEAFNKLGQSAEKAGELSFRASNRIRTGFLEAAGVHGPVTELGERFEYLGYISDRTGLSVEQLFTKFGPTLAASAAVGVLAEELNRVADAGAKAFGEEGLGSHSWLENLMAGAGFIDTLSGKIEASADVATRQSAAFHRATRLQSRREEDAGQPATVTTNVKRSKEDNERLFKEQMDGLQKEAEELEKKRAEVRGKSFGQLAEAFTDATGKKSVIPAAMMGPIGPNIALRFLGQKIQSTVADAAEQGYGDQLTAKQRQMAALRAGAVGRESSLTDQAVTAKTETRGYTAEAEFRSLLTGGAQADVADAQSYAARISAEDKLHQVLLQNEREYQRDLVEEVNKGLITQEDYQKELAESGKRVVSIRAETAKIGFDRERQQNIAGLEAIADDERQSYSKRVDAIRELRDERKKTEGPGEQALEDERANEKIKELGKHQHLSDEFYTNSDAFEHAGFETGGPAGNAATEGWRALHKVMQKNLEATLANEDPTRPLTREVY